MTLIDFRKRHTARLPPLADRLQALRQLGAMRCRQLARSRQGDVAGGADADFPLRATTGT